MINIQFKKLHEDAELPVQGSVDAACFDLVITDIDHMEMNPNFVTLRYGFATAIPKGYKAVIIPRSSFTHRGWVMANSPGQIDSDYRGEWISKLEAIPEHWSDYQHQLQYPDFPYAIGDRAAQFYVEKIVKIEFSEVKKLYTTKRGAGGFGSTDKKK